MPEKDIKEELLRITKTSDMMVSAHAFLKERYALISIISDLLLFGCTLALTVIVFSDVKFLIKNLGGNYTLYIGLLAIFTFIYSLLGNAFDWKIKAERHKQAFERYSELKFESKDILTRLNEGEEVECLPILNKYYNVTPFLIPIPENLFNKCKQHHKMKVAISKRLDENPATSILIYKIKLWFRDNFKL